MNRNLKKILSFDIVTIDGTKAGIKDFLIDENDWIIRYFEVDFGNLFKEKRVLIPIDLIKSSRIENDEIYINISDAELEKCPKPEENLPVSRRYEEELFKYLQYDYYWTYAGAIPRMVPKREIDETDIGTSLRSYNEVKGYTIHTLDGEFGKINDFVTDDNRWEIQFAVVDTSIWLPLSKKIVLDIASIESISYSKEAANVRLNSDALKNAPEYDPDANYDYNFENSVHANYAKDA